MEADTQIKVFFLANSDSYIYNDQTADEFNGAKAFTAMGWFKQTSVASDKNYMLFNLVTKKENDASLVNMISIYINSADNTIKIGVRSNADDSMVTLNTKYICSDIDEWHHYAFVVDYENIGKDGAYIGFYVDGKQSSWTNVAKLSQRYLTLDSYTQIRIGGSGSQVFDGCADRVRIYNKRVANSDINQEALTQKEDEAQPKPVPGSESYITAWNCDTQVNGKLNDLKGNFDGMINNMTSMMIISGKGIKGTPGLENQAAVSSALYAPGLGHHLKEKILYNNFTWKKKLKAKNICMMISDLEETAHM